MSVVLFKGVNVGKGPRLETRVWAQTLSEALGSCVVGVLNSGNLVCAPSVSVPQLRILIDELGEKSGLSCEYVVVSLAELNSLLPQNPWPDQDPSRVLVYFSEKPIDDTLVERLTALARLDERMAVRSGRLWVWYPRSIAESRVSASILDRVFGFPVTGRNVNTLQKILSKVPA